MRTGPGPRTRPTATALAAAAPLAVVPPPPSEVSRSTRDRNGAAALALATETMLETAGVQGRVFQLINAYRVRGHLFAHLDPLGQAPALGSELRLENFGLSDADLDTVFPYTGISWARGPGRPSAKSSAICPRPYCSSIGASSTRTSTIRRCATGSKTRWSPPATA